ncbi:B3 domain-containing protein Os01g0234100-like [Cynara cardunculus var. scolymus]|uniref:B3 domain-containing protein Os01g0234100-like n=1 Tax=Cynara cardunculus var. scolymus TaxID=59895 RepID=UPI000D6251C7|nr:B3 domain-containing protein Os01g0234100-like [Cynara cardunculus var. scolymus]
MAIAPQSTTPLCSKWKQTKEVKIKKRFLQQKSSFPKQVNYDLASNLIISYDPKVAASAQPPDSQAKSAAIERATEVQASLPSELPSFVKPMLPSHVTGGFWLGFPKKFCDVHLPKHDEMVVLVDEDQQEFNTKYLVDKTGLSGGWRGFSIAHKLLEGDALVFQLIEHWKFKVYIVRVNGLNEIDGALGLLNLVPCGMNVCRIKKDSRNPQRAEDMDIDLHQNDIQERGLVTYDQSGDDGEYIDSEVSEGLRFSQSVLEFKDIKGIDDFSIVMDGLIIDSEIPKHFQIKYYDLCCSQKTYLHENLLKGLNVQLAVGIILETVTIADAIKACKVTTTRDNFETWDKTLKAFEEVGMRVGFLQDRISKLIGLLFESEEILEAKRNEQVKAEDEMRVMNQKLCGVREAIKNLNVEIESLEMKCQKLKPVFLKEANAPW